MHSEIRQYRFRVTASAVATVSVRIECGGLHHEMTILSAAESAAHEAAKKLGASDWIVEGPFSVCDPVELPLDTDEWPECRVCGQRHKHGLAHVPVYS